jgi:hypothetical protein
MTDRKFVNDAGSWKRLGRRWTTILAAMLVTNFCLIVLAMAGYGGGTHAEERNGDVAVDRSAAPSDTGEEVAAASNQEQREAASAVEQQATETAVITATVVSAPAAAPLRVQAGGAALPDEPPTPANVAESSPPANPPAADAVPTVTTDGDGKIPYEDGIVLVNPKKTGGTIHFVVEGEIYSLEPGTYCLFPGHETKRVVFHKGDEEADVEHELVTGLFAFTVGSTGWELSPVDSQESRKALRGCKLAAE